MKINQKVSGWQHISHQSCEKQTNKVGVCRLFSSHLKKRSSLSCSAAEIKCAFFVFLAFLFFFIPVTSTYWWKKNKSKEANDNMFDKPGTSCLSITCHCWPRMLDKWKTWGWQLQSACSLFWLGWNQRSVINRGLWSVICLVGTPVNPQRSGEKQHFITSPYQSGRIITPNHALGR